MTRRIPTPVTQRARALRRGATPQELVLWHAISRIRPKFTRQLAIDPFYGDFACRQVRLIVEVDGSQHAESGRDERRTVRLAEKRWTVIRFWNSDIDDNCDGVVAAILNMLRELGAEPQFAPTREGRPRRPRR